MSNEERRLVPSSVRADQTELPSIDLAELEQGSPTLALEAALAIQAGKLAPFGYEKVAAVVGDKSVFTVSFPRMLLLVAEAEVAGKTAELQRRFPEVPGYVQDYVEQLKLVMGGTFVDELIARVSSVDYSFSETLERERNIAKRIGEIS